MSDGPVERKNAHSELSGRDVDGAGTTVRLGRSVQVGLVQTVDPEVDLAEMRDRFMRAEAEMANVRARARKDVDDAKQCGQQKSAADVVDAAENLRRGLDSISGRQAEDGLVAQLYDGFAGVERSFVAMLERNEIKRNDPTGSAFDAVTQQTVEEQETSMYPAGTVMRALTSTWTLNGRLLRPAMVVVARPYARTARTSLG